MFMRFSPSFLCTGFLGLCLVANPLGAAEQPAQELPDAAALIAKLQEQLKQAPKEAVVVDAPTEGDSKSLASYKQLYADKAGPAALAAAWAAAMFERYEALTESNRWNDDEDAAARYAYLFSHMPAPAAWPHLSAAFKKVLPVPVEKDAAQPVPEKKKKGLLSRLFSNVADLDMEEDDGETMAYLLSLIPAILNEDWVAVHDFLIDFKVSKHDYTKKQIQHAIIEVLLGRERNSVKMAALLDHYLAGFLPNEDHQYHFLKITQSFYKKIGIIYFQFFV